MSEGIRTLDTQDHNRGHTLADGLVEDAWTGHEASRGYDHRASEQLRAYGRSHPAPRVRYLTGTTGCCAASATLTANMAQGWSHGPVVAMVAAWPAVSLVESYELARMFGRTSRRWAGQISHRGAPSTAIRTATPGAG